jgi:Zn ribbon nucleic-acid-binding protein
MTIRCPKCNNTETGTIWEDNFWSGCDKCGWMSSCENSLAIIRTNTKIDDKEVNEWDD